VIGGGFFYNPYPYYYSYPYYPYYPYPPGYGYGYGYYPSTPPPPDTGYQEQAPPPPGYQEQAPPPPAGEESLSPPAEEPEGDSSTVPQNAEPYGLVRLLSVPDGGQVSLDGRYWLQAHDLASQWFRVSPGRHTVGVSAGGRSPVQLQVDVVAGRQQEIRLGPLA